MTMRVCLEPRASACAGAVFASLMTAFASAATVTSQSIVSGGSRASGVTTYDSGLITGNPAVSSAGGMIVAGTAFNWTASSSGTARLGAGNGSMGSYVSIGGSADASSFNTGGVTADNFIDWTDSLTPTGLTGGAIIEIPFQITGDVTIAKNTTSQAQTAAVFLRQNLCNSSGGTLPSGVACQINDPSGTFGDPWQKSTTVKKTVYVDFALGATGSTAIELNLWTEAAVGWSDPGNFTQLLYLATATGDFSHTGVFGPAVVLDAATRQPLAGVSLTSASGYDYLAGTSPVPLPGSLLLLISGLGATTFVVRRRGQAMRD